MYSKADSNLNWTDTFYVMQKWTKDYWATLKQIKIMFWTAVLICHNLVPVIKYKNI